MLLEDNYRQLNVNYIPDYEAKPKFPFEFDSQKGLRPKTGVAKQVKYCLSNKYNFT